MDAKIVAAGIAKVVTDAKALEFGDPDYKSKETKLWADVDALAKGPGLVGKNLRFSVADGYAHYIVSKVRTHVVQLVHLEVGDHWHFAGVYEDTAGNLCMSRPVAERTLKCEAAFNEIFGIQNFVPLSAVK